MNNKYHTKFDKWVRGLVKKYIEFLSKNSNKVLFAFVLMIAVSVFFSLKLKLVTDFFELLPQETPSVKVIKKYMDRVGGVNKLLVGIETQDFESGKKFVHDLVDKLNKLPDGTIRYVDYNVNNTKDYFNNNALLYLDQSDIDDVYKRLKRKIEFEKKEHSPFNLNLMDELEGKKKKKEKVDFNIDDIEEKYKGDVESISENYKEGYYTNKDGSLLAVSIVPFGSSLSFKQAKQINNTVEKIIKELNPLSYSKDMKVGLAGSMRSRMEENESIKQDIVSTALLVFLLVSASIFIFIPSFSAIGMLVINLCAAVAVTMAITYFYIGSLNMQTAFMTSLIVGTGVNYGIIYISRFLEEIAKGLNAVKANIVTLQNVYLPTLLASGTTLVAFLSLFIASNRGFNQFGFIGSVGILVTWLFTMLFIPLFILSADKIKILKLKKKKFDVNPYVYKSVMWVINKKRTVFVAAIVLMVVGFVSFSFYVPNSLEYNFSNLKNKNSDTNIWKEKLDKVFEKQSLSPTIVLTDSLEDSKMFCDVIKKNKENASDGSMRTIKECYDILSLVPKDQENKLPYIRKIKELLYDNSIKWLDDDQYEKVLELRNSIPDRVLTIHDLPLDIKKNFTEVNGEIGSIAYVEQDDNHSLSLRDNLLDYADSIKKVHLPNNKVIETSGEWIIFSDLLEGVKNDIPKVSVLSFVLVFFVVLFLMGSLRASFVVISCLMFGMLTMLGAIAVFGIKINFFNFIAIPLTMGVSVDYPLNVYSRYLIDKKSDFKTTIMNTGSAVLACCLTTLVSYAILLAANSRALASFGRLGLIGEIACISGALFLVPTFHYLIGKKGR